MVDTVEDVAPHNLTNTNVTAGVAGRTLSGPDRQAWTAAGFNGTSSTLRTSGTPVLNTAASFTVAAWVRADELTRSKVIVSQPDTMKSPFELQVRRTRTVATGLRHRDGCLLLTRVGRVIS